MSRWLKTSFLLILAITDSAWTSLCEAQTLRQEADRIGILVGTAVNPVYLTEPAYVSTLAREFNMLEPEDAMKWTALRPDEKTFVFDAADRLVEFAEAHDMKVRGHNLVWGTHNPKWLTEGHSTSEQLSILMQQHIQRVVSHYRGRVFAWDVVNEAFDAHGQLRDSIWYNQPGIGLAGRGTAYVEQVFRWARMADPKALLFYNEAEAEAVNAKSDAIYAMAKDFKKRGVPIDGIGLQMHVFNLTADARSIAANIKRLSKLGLQVQITETDVALPVDLDGNLLHPQDLKLQADLYREIAKLCLQNRRCTAVQTWGFTDRYSWIRRFTHGTKGAALPFDTGYKPKPAYDALLKVFAAQKAR